MLLLDEPTAALDGETEAEVVTAVRRLAAGRTVLVVVHRPALLGIADRVVRLTGSEEPGALTGPVRAGRSAEHRAADTTVAAESAEPADEAAPAGPGPAVTPGAGRGRSTRRGVLARVRALSGARRGGWSSPCCSGVSRSAARSASWPPPAGSSRGPRSSRRCST